VKRALSRFVLRRKKAAAHAGAWKVAYADFVTGMMSLFLVLWILSQDEEVIIATTRFFRDPYMAGVPKSTPVEQKDARPGSMVDQIVGRSDTTMRNTDDTTSIDIDVLHRIAQDWYKRLKLHEMDDETIQIEATTDGIKVTLFYGDEKPLFEDSDSKLTDHGKKVMQRMSWLLSQHVLVFRVDSHSNHLSQGRGKDPEISEWDMSLAQGTEVTDALIHYSGGELSEKLERITGHGSTKPNQRRYPNQPVKNRRVELSLVLDMSKEDLKQFE
tara:strand:- start:29425 stop:30237 length:813 start_codon:yes stop_codon:yes gene_type:complete